MTIELSNKRIKGVQAFLIVAGHNTENLIADGELGEQTELALRQYQEATDGLEVTGQIDRATVQRMYDDEVSLPDGMPTLKQIQAYLIMLILSEGLEDTDLIADGELGEQTLLTLKKELLEGGAYPHEPIDGEFDND